MGVTPPTRAGAAGALAQAKAALAAGHDADALRWLERGDRVSPNDPTIQFMLASLLATDQPSAALDILLTLLARQPWHRDAAVAAVTLQLRLGRATVAATGLSSLLSQGTPPDTALFGQVAGAVCRAAGAPGWIGLDGQGRLRGALADVAAGAIDLTVDGETTRLAAGAQGKITQELAAGWQSAALLTATYDGKPLLGSGLRPARFAEVEGVLDQADSGGASGWARLSADPASCPDLVWECQVGRQRRTGPVTLELDTTDRTDQDSRPRWRFSLPPSVAARASWVRVADRRGRDLWGSPVTLGMDEAAANRAARAIGAGLGGKRGLPIVVDTVRPLSAALLPHRRRTKRSNAQPPGCDVVIPVHGGAAELEACLASVTPSLPDGSRLVLVDDGSTEPRIAAMLRQQAAAGAMVLTHPVARGFPAAVNTGLAALLPRKRDVVILNSDTLVPQDWLQRLSLAAYSDAAVGSCTPLTNDGTLVSYPTPDKHTPAPGSAALAGLNHLCWQAHGAAVVDIPSGVGFCMLLKAACLAEVGLLREDQFAQGYGEENDWCLRAAHLGWRNVAAPGVFVAHHGGKSFGAGKAFLMARNAQVLERLHPGYEAYVRTALAAEPLAAARRAIDIQAVAEQGSAPVVAIITHSDGGGVARHVAWRASRFAREGLHTVQLKPSGDLVRVEGATAASGPCCNLTFAMPGELDALADLLRTMGVRRIELHHLLGHHAAILELPARLGIPFDAFVHDYAAWCPRIGLTGRGNRYCGEPTNPADCENCVADLGSRYPEHLTVAELRRQSADWLQQARRVNVACGDVAARLQRQFPAVQPKLAAWEDPAPPVRSMASHGRGVHVAIVGAIGLEKGYEVLLACARDAARRDLDLRFTVVGHTIDDDRLLATQRAFVTGRFAEDDGLELLRQTGANLGFVPSVCPETWCYGLSTLWQAGLAVAAFSIGAQAERVRESGRGFVVPLGLSADRINDMLLAYGQPAARHVLPAARPVAERASAAAATL